MFRNREFRRFAVLFLVMAAVTVVLGFVINRAAGILTIAGAVIFGTVFFIFTRKRYRNLARLSNQIDLVLHNSDRIELGNFDEGELSILHSEITKMTLCIREQNEALKKDKQYLADSLADIAHQLRTPLTSANILLSFLANNFDEKERQAFVHETEELLLRMDWLITALLRMSRLDAGVVEFQNEPVSVKGLVDSSFQSLAIPMELRNIELRRDIPENAFIKGDSGWLSEAIQNILKNCMESMGENGTIEIICKETPLFTELTIHDSGRGFEHGELPHLFDRFYRGNSSTGYGIGLALCKMIITKQNGTRKAETHKNGGALFRIRFPKVTDVSSESHRAVTLD
ncbi:MAG: HAMP domain-containing histidine kinase [Clostridiales bacterium]|jgi:signal transduction histidine kinase|nr:HAMP domain-containing histidine kinase [Clostridiales bacterium]